MLALEIERPHASLEMFICFSSSLAPYLLTLCPRLKAPNSESIMYIHVVDVGKLMQLVKRFNIWNMPSYSMHL